MSLSIINHNNFKVDEFGIYLSKLLKERFAGLIHTINDDVADREKLDKGSSKLIVGQSIIEEKINNLKFDFFSTVFLRKSIDTFFI